MHFSLFISAFALTAVNAIPQAATTTTPARSTATIPFYSAPNTFTPTATGNTAIPGSVISITNTAGAGSLSDTFVYTAALSTVAPTGNVTKTLSGPIASASNLLPDPKNLQTAAAKVLRVLQPLSGLSTLSSLIAGASVATLGALLILA